MPRTGKLRDGHPLWMAQGSMQPGFAGEDPRWIVAQRPGDSPGVDGADREAWRGDEAGAGSFPPELARLGQETVKTPASVLTGHRGAAETEAWTKPFPEGIEELSSPTP